MMGSCRLLIVVLALILFSSAQQGSPTVYKVEGTVLNSLTRSPLPRALVQLSGRAMLTGLEGEFSFSGVPGGRVQLMLSKPGYFTPGATAKSFSHPVTVDVGPDTGKLVLKLVPESVISGHVNGNDEEPLEGAGIQVLRYISANGRRQLAPVPVNERTDEDGNFRFAELAPGQYYVAVRAGNVARRVLGAQTSRGNQAYPAIFYYPGTQDFASAVPVDLAPGQHMDLQFSLTMAPAFKVAGVLVTEGSWAQVSPPVIIDQMGEALFRASQFDSSSGQFEFRAVPAGTYNVQLGGRDQQNHFVSLFRTLTVSRPIMGLKLVLHSGIDIPVVVRRETSKPPPPGSCAFSLPNGEIRQSDCSDYPLARVDLVSSGAAQSRFSTDFLPAKEPGTLAVRGVTPGRYMVRAHANFTGYVQSLRSGETDLFRQELVVPEEGAVAPIEVVVRDDAGLLKIQVRTGKPGELGTVLLISEGEPFLEPQIVGVVAGHTELLSAPLAPGEYKVFAFDSIDGLDYTNPEAIAPYASSAAHVTVSANGNTSVTVDLVHTGDER